MSEFGDFVSNNTDSKVSARHDNGGMEVEIRLAMGVGALPTYIPRPLCLRWSSRYALCRAFILHVLSFTVQAGSIESCSSQAFASEANGMMIC